MNPEEKEMLVRTARIAEDNNRMLRNLRSASRWGSFFGLIKWIFIIGPLIFAYFYLQPYLDALMGTYGKVQGQVDTLQKVSSQIPDLSKLLNGQDIESLLKTLKGN